MRKDWDKEKIGDACDIFNGLWTGKRPPFVEVGVIRNTNFTKDGLLDDSEIAYLSVEEKQFESRKLLKGDIILEKSGGGPKQPVGRVALFEKNEGDFSFSNFTSAIRIKDRNKLDYNFLHRFLFFEYISGSTETMQRQSTGIRNLQLNEYKEIIIPIPPLPEQKRIVSILDKAFAAIDKAKANAAQNLNNVKELYENSLYNIFEDRNNWIASELGKHATFRNGMNFSKSSKGEKIKIVGVKDFQNKFWIPFEELDSVNLDSDLKEIDALNKDDIIAVRSNGNPELIGRTLLAGDFEEKVSHSGFTIRIRLNTDELLPNYVCHFLKSQKARKCLIESGNGVSIKSLNQGSLSSLTINYPKSRTEQKQIVSKIESLKEETEKLEKIYCRKLNDLDELKRSILHKAFNGEL